MTPLTQQLKDKKKELILWKNGLDLDGKKLDREGHFKNPYFGMIAQAEIAILEQAIAEIKGWKQAVDTLDKLLKEEINKNIDLEEKLQKQRQEILDKIDKLIKSSKEDGLLYPKYRPSIEAYLEVLKDYIEQLNQPKTENGVENTKSELNSQQTKPCRALANTKPDRTEDGSSYTKDKTADTPQDKNCLTPKNNISNPVVSNLLQKQRQEEIGFLENIKKLICKVTPEMQLDNEILKEICPEIFYNCENRLEKLNQPKTEDGI